MAKLLAEQPAGLPPAALAAFLGEDPSASALRGRVSIKKNSAVTDEGPRIDTLRLAVAGVGAGRRHPGKAADSPPDTPELRSVGFRPSAFDYYDLDDDRPPTPTPAGFEAMVLCQGPRSEVLSAGDGGRAGQGIGGRNHSVVRESAAGAVVDAVLNSEHSRLQDSRHPVLPHRPPTGDAFFVEGVGWCDAYGRTLESSSSSRGAASGASDGVKPGSSGYDANSCPVAARALSASAAYAGRTQETSRQAPRNKSRPRESGPIAASGRAVACGASWTGSAPRRLTQKEMDRNWESLGGV